MPFSCNRSSVRRSAARWNLEALVGGGREGFIEGVTRVLGPCADGPT